jgi:ribose transport system substrate-binding protein
MRRQAACVAAILAFGTVVAACSSSGSTAPGQQSKTGSASGGGATQKATTALEKWYQGTDRALPTSAPKPQPGKNVWVISCAQAAEGCSVPAKAIEEAGTKIGWHVKIVDGQFNPSEESNGIRAAVANHADAIVVIAGDCPNTKTALQDAKNAGVVIYADFSVDCDEAGGGPKLFDGYASFDAAGTSYGAYLKTIHDAVVVDWVTSKTNGAGHVLLVNETDLPNAQIEAAGYKALFPTVCPGCTMTDVKFTGQDLISGNLKNLVAAALAKDPSINVVVAPYDAAITIGVGAAVQQQVGRHIMVTGYEGLSANIAQIKAGGPGNLATGFPSQWVGWSTVDELNRILNKQSVVDEGMGYQAVAKGHNQPTATTFYDGNVAGDGKPRQDYQSNFLKNWGLS